MSTAREACGRVDVGKVMVSLGLHGFRAGGAGDKNGGVQKQEEAVQGKSGGKVGKVGKVKARRVFGGRSRKYLGG